MEGNFRALVLDCRKNFLAGGEAMLFPVLTVGAFYPDNRDVMEIVVRDGRFLADGQGACVEILNLRPYRYVASFPCIYFDLKEGNESEPGESQ